MVKKLPEGKNQLSEKNKPLSNAIATKYINANN